ncbi:MAG: response regulator [Proteobacteria bacterium]|nr:response regulator [Pseudomonadota bacterium]
MTKSFILYIEDEDFQAKIFSKIIESELDSYNYKVKIIKNGKDFIALLNNENKIFNDINLNEIGLILIDLAMHDVSGVQLLQETQKHQINLPVAILTAREDESIKQQIINLGAKDYFVKGKDIAELSRLRDFIIINMQ